MSASRIEYQSPEQPRHRTAVAQNESDIIHNTHTTSVEVSATKRNPLETTVFVQMVRDIKAIKQVLDDLKEQPALAPNGSQPRLEASKTPFPQNTPARPIIGKETEAAGGFISAIKKTGAHQPEVDDSIMIDMREFKSPSKERNLIVKNFEDIKAKLERNYLDYNKKLHPVHTLSGKAKVDQFQGVVEKMQQAAERLTSGIESMAAQGPKGAYQANKSTDALAQALQSFVKYFEQLPTIEAKRVETQAQMLQLSREEAEFNKTCKDEELRRHADSNNYIKEFLGRISEAVGNGSKDPKNFLT